MDNRREDRRSTCKGDKICFKVRLKNGESRSEMKVFRKTLPGSSICREGSL